MTQTPLHTNSPSKAVIGDRNESVQLFVRELTVLDYAYYDDTRGLLGGSLDVDVTFIGHLDGEGVVFDFSLAKKAVKKVIDDLCDHRLVLPKNLVHSNGDGLRRVESILENADHVQYLCPEEGLCQLEAPRITLDSIKSYLSQEIMATMPSNVDGLLLDFREEDLGDAPHYRYTHGLKQHYGNCQRLVHGHRNRVDVFVNGQRQRDLEIKICELWKDIHLAFPENISEDNFIVGQRQDHLKTVEISYTSSQGLFKLALPGRSVYVMPYETTVENISRHLRDLVQSWVGPSESVEVFAYEGIRKGSRSATLT